jgi:hypothetical protein
LREDDRVQERGDPAPFARDDSAWFGADGSDAGLNAGAAKTRRKNPPLKTKGGASAKAKADPKERHSQDGCAAEPEQTSCLPTNRAGTI